jgi:CubicO group peptidase (beta-lactamase class C family)
MASPSHAEDCRIGRDFPVADATPERLRQLVAALDRGKYDIHALLVLRGCTLLYEGYGKGWSRDRSHDTYSVTKSVASTLVGALLSQGKLRSITASISELVPRTWITSEDGYQRARRIKLQNVMQMTSGLDFRYNPQEHPIFSRDIDRFNYALSANFIVEPGIRFNYSDGDAVIEGAAIAAVAGEGLERFAKTALFDPLEMVATAWPYADAAGRTPGGWALRMRPMDMVKLGRLYLQKGSWNGERVFDRDYPALAWRPGVAADYGLNWWIGSAREAKGMPYVFADGFRSQKIYVFPSLDVVAAMTADVTGEAGNRLHRVVVGALAEIR